MVKQCESHGAVRMEFVDAYQNWRHAACPWCRIDALEALCKTSITFFGEDFDDEDIDSSCMSSQYTAHYKALIVACEGSVPDAAAE